LKQSEGSKQKNQALNLPLDLGEALKSMIPMSPIITPDMPFDLQSIMMNIMRPTVNSSIKSSKDEIIERVSSEKNSKGTTLTEEQVMEIVDRATKKLEEKLERKIDERFASFKLYIDERLTTTNCDSVQQ